MFEYFKVLCISLFEGLLFYKHPDGFFSPQIIKDANETLYSSLKRNLMDLTTYTTGQGSDSAGEQNSSAGEDARSRTRPEPTLIV